ncbi:MAG UNVERIFIED_CONTAM: hypothetical protein LVT10_20200 [Anaerolineae bacterium]
MLNNRKVFHKSNTLIYNFIGEDKHERKKRKWSQERFIKWDFPIDVFPLHSHGIELDVEETLSQPIVVAGAMTLQENWLEHIHTQTNTPEVHEQTEVVTGDAVQFEKIERAIHDLLDAFNVNWQDPNYTETPERVAKAYLKYWANGYGRLPGNEITRSSPIPAEVAIWSWSRICSSTAPVATTLPPSKAWAR